MSTKSRKNREAKSFFDLCRYTIEVIQYPADSDATLLKLNANKPLHTFNFDAKTRTFESKP